MKRIINTLSQKWPEYLLEILVIIIGIYGAFALESWNTNRLEIKKAKSYKDELYKELIASKSHIETSIEFHTEKIRRIDKFLTDYQTLDNTDVIFQSLKHIDDSVAFKSFEPPRLVLDNLLTTGSVEHLPTIAGQIQELINAYNQSDRINSINIEVSIEYQIAFNKSLDPIVFQTNKIKNYKEHKLVEKWSQNKDSPQYLYYLQYVSSLRHYHNRNITMYSIMIKKIEQLQGAIE